MNLSSISAGFAQEKLLLVSLADYFRSLSDRALTAISYVTAALNGDYGTIAGTLALPDTTDMSYSYNRDVSHESDDDTVSQLITPEALLTACALGESTVYATDHTLLNIKDVTEQLSDSYTVNVCLEEALRSISSSGSDTASAILSDFKSRVELRMGGLTETMCQYGYQFIAILQSGSMTIRQKIDALMNFVGLNDLSDQTDPIGIPVCDLGVISNTNVFTAWATTLPNTITEWFTWLKQTVQKVRTILIGIANAMLGSTLWRTMTKFVATISGSADAFQYTNYAEDFAGFDDISQTFVITDAPEAIQHWLSQTTYVTLCLPCSTLSLWAYGNYIYVRRFVKPCLTPLNTIRVVFEGMTRYQDPESGAVSWSTAYVTGNDFKRLQSLLSNDDSKYISDDATAYASIARAAYVDGMYLTFIKGLVDAGYTINDVDGDAHITLPNGGHVTEDNVTFICGEAFKWIDRNAMYSDNTAPNVITGAILANRIMASNYDDSTGVFTNTEFSGSCSANNTDYLMNILRLCVGGDMFWPYSRSATTPTGRYNVMRTADLANVLTRTISTIGVVFAVVIAARTLHTIKKKAWALANKSSTLAFDAIENGTLDKKTLTKLYHMQIKANILDSISSSITGLVPNLLSNVANKIVSATTAACSSVRDCLSGTDDNGDTSVTTIDETNQKVTEVKRLIKTD